LSSVSVIIAARNAAETLGATLAGLADQDFPGEFEVVVVDDGSTDATAAVAAAAPLATIIVSCAGVGPGPARNAGVAASSNELIAFTDADCIPTPGWLAAGATGLADHELVQGAVHANPATPGGPFARTVWVTREGGLYECASLFIRRATFEALGGFEDWLPARLGKPLAEDAWLGWRVRRAGGSTAFSEAALVHHAVFERGVAGFVAERARLVYFPAIARQMPEVRRTLFYGRVFLSPRSAAFDLALAGAGTAMARRSPRPLVAAIPWLWMIARRALPWGRRAPAVAAGEAAADAVGAVALAVGSARARSAVL
jgi:glycosyltransferase involved in cell wall biosynthesis